MLLPDKIEIQITDKSGLPSSLGNILFGLKLFDIDGSYHNYSFFKTDSNGKIVLTKQQIIDNTEMTLDKINSVKTTKFELYIWDGESTNNYKRDLERLLNLYENEELIKRDLISLGIQTDRLEIEMKKIRQKALEDKILFEEIRFAINEDIVAEKERVDGEWTDDLPKDYKFIVVKK